MSELFRTILIKPLFNALVGIYNVVPGHDFGIAIIILTLLIKFIFVPLTIKSLRSQKAITKIQPKIKELQDKHKNDKQAAAQATMALYKEHNVNPLSGCLPILIQLPVIIALYQVFLAAFKSDNLQLLYGFVHNPGVINKIAFGFLDLASKSPVLAIAAGVFQFIQAKKSFASQQTAPGEPISPALAMSKQMMYFFPVMIVFITWSLPAGLALYWVTTTLFSIGEQWYINRNK